MADSAINFDVVRDALYTWFKDALGHTAMWGNQDSNQPCFPYGTVTIAGMERLGGRDETRHEFDSGAANGEEYTVSSVGQRVLLVSFQARNTAKAARNNYNEAPFVLMSNVQSSLGLPATREFLYGANLAISDEGVIVQADLPESDTWISVANLDVRFLTSSCLEQTDTLSDPSAFKPNGKLGYYDKVELTGDIDPDSLDFTEIIDAS